MGEEIYMNIKLFFFLLIKPTIFSLPSIHYNSYLAEHLGAHVLFTMTNYPCRHIHSLDECIEERRPLITGIKF